MRGPVVSELGDDDADGDHADTHDNGADLQERLATNPIDDQLFNVSLAIELGLDLTDHGRDSADEEDDAGDAGCQQGDGSSSESQTDKDIRGIVDD